MSNSDMTDLTPQELEPCPFCGKTPEIETRDVEPQGDPWHSKTIATFVLCDCGACLFDEQFHLGFDDDNAATKKWNTRAGRRLVQAGENSELKLAYDALHAIADYAHANSTGPAVPDHLWEVRRMAHDALVSPTEALQPASPDKEVRWISVSEKLPELYVGGVLTFPYREDDLLGVYMKMKSDLEPQWYSQDRDGYYWPIRVTHWMSLPSPPSEKVKDGANTWREAKHSVAPTTCAANRDGECNHPLCPQLRDGEPEKSGRHCPIDIEDEEV